MDHITKSVEAKLVTRCQLPLTGRGVVSRVITDLGVFDVTGTGFEVVDLAEGVDYDNVAAVTDGVVTDRRDGLRSSSEATMPEASAPSTSTCRDVAAAETIT
jgi:3-oxoacid CoA-transferase subunit B